MSHIETSPTTQAASTFGVGDLVVAIHAACQDSDGGLCPGDGGWLSVEIVDLIVAMLRADPAMPKRSATEWELHFGSLRQRLEDYLEDLLEVHRLHPGRLAAAIMDEVLGT